MKRIVFAFIVAVALLAGKARAVTPDLVTHEATEEKSSIVVTVTGTLKIVLPAMDEPGHEWQIMSNDPRVLKPVGELKPLGGAKAIGKPVPWEITFLAQQRGRSLLRFVYTTNSPTHVATLNEIREIAVRVQ
jgi:hypothetical protein